MQELNADPVMVDELETRIAALEQGKSYDATKAAVEEVEKEFLIKFREMKASLQNESKGAARSSNDSKELQELRAENSLLKMKVQKLEYRVQHCVDSMEQMYTFVEK